MSKDSNRPEFLGRISLDLPVFNSYNAPNGFLSRDLACHALMYYALTARKAYEENIQGFAVQYEEALSNQSNFRQMFESIAMLYGVSPDAMARYWPAVDMQFFALQLPTLPDEERYRFNKTPELRSH